MFVVSRVKNFIFLCRDAMVLENADILRKEYPNG